MNFKKRGETRLTGNEKSVLKILLKNSRTSDVDIAEKLKISSQFVNKIRRKLESIGIIKGYTTEVDYPSLGINTFALVMFEIAPLNLREYYEVNKLMFRNLIGFYEVFKNGATHIALFAFRSLNELDEFFNILHIEHSEYFKIKNIYVFPTRGFLKHSSTNLFYNLVKDFGKETIPTPPPLVYYSEEKKESDVKKLSVNEKNILRLLIINSRSSYTKVASEIGNLNITNRAISKIKERLENKGVIKGYSLSLDYKKLGIEIFAFIFLTKKLDYWKLKDALCKLANNAPNVIGCYRLNEGSLHVLFCGFRNLGELESYCHHLQFKNKDILEISKIYVTSDRGILKDSPSHLLEMILE